jgi:SagB-type dehydrogenase family enzyme
MAEGIGDRFQQETKYYPFKMPRWENKPAVEPDMYKIYPASIKIKLPLARMDVEIFLDHALRRRRSVRTFTSAPIRLEQLSYLLWASTGIQRIENGCEFRTVPSAGALYPVETYVVVNNVAGLGKGIYHYGIREHELEQLHLGDYSQRISSAAMGQAFCARAGVVFIWTAVFARCKYKYGERAYRYIYLDAGHIAQNLALASAGLGLGSCPVAAVYDDEVNSIIDVDGQQESVLYLTAVGWPRMGGT